MSIYPPIIADLSRNPEHCREPADANGTGTSASLICGSFVRYHLRIDPESLRIVDIGFRSNGCGFAVAAAEIIAGEMAGRSLKSLAGLGFESVIRIVEQVTGELPDERYQCAEIAFEAFSRAVADYRTKYLEEFAGERALICMCFGVDEETIERSINIGGADSVDAVSAATNAGSGCGSCRMLIQSMLDSLEM